MPPSDSPITSADRSAGTRDRLLEAAGQAFAERGFRQATVRAICASAGTNIASVNYHFGGKRELYAAVLQDAHERMLERYPAFLDTRPDDPPQARLSAFVRSFLLRVLGPGRPAWHGRLMLREMADPTSALDGVVDRSIRGHFASLNGVVRELLGPGADDERCRLAAMSIVAQCVFYRMGQPVIERLAPGRYGEREIDAIAAHVTAFSLAGLAALACHPASHGATPTTTRRTKP